jgi:Restriction endonuclease
MSDQTPTCGGCQPSRRNDGTGVECLVQLIESSQLPKGFTVEMRRQVFDDDGTLVAELDILISGKVGTKTHKFLIECRDRPSEGAAPRSWIEQLIGRRQSLGLSDVMAVSSTGFAPGAKKLAEESKIELRHLQDLKYDDVAHWLSFTAPLIVRHGEFHAVRLGVTADDGRDTGWQVQLNVEQKRFRRRENQELASLLQIWQRVINDEAIWRAVPENGSPLTARIAVGSEILREFTFVADEGDLDIGSLEFDATLTASPSQMPLGQAARYISQPVNAGDQETFAELGRWVGSSDDLVKKMIVIGFPKKPGT